MSGDIFRTYAPAIGHGVNTVGAMGAGIAVQFKERFPGMYDQYHYLCLQGELKPGETYVYEAGTGQLGIKMWVYNIASQDLPGPNARLEWLESGVKAMLIHARDNGVKSVALPRIASGIGGLDEVEVENLLTRLVAEYPVNIELWTFPR